MIFLKKLDFHFLIYLKMVLKENRFGIEPEITAKISKQDIKIYEVGVKYFGRKYNEGKKIKFHHIFPVIFQIIKGRIN